MIKLENIKTTKEVAKILRCTSRNVSLMVNNGKLKPIKILENKNFLFDLTDILNYKSLK